MATRAKAKISTPWDASGIEIWRWTGLGNGDDGDPLTFPQFSDRSVQVKGTFGAGGTVIIEASNDIESPTYAPVTDPNQNAISFTSPGREQILDISYLIRPRVTAGDGTTSITVTIVAKK